MIIDSRTLFADAEPAFGTAATRLEGDVIDLQTARDIGNGQAVWVQLVVTTAFVGGAGALVRFQVASDAGAAIATDGSATIHIDTGAIAVANLPAGKVFQFALPLEGNAYERYLGVLVTTSVATTTAGAFTAFIALHPAKWEATADGVS